MQTADTTMLTDNIFFAGCSVRCDFCFNKELWSGGREMTPMEILSFLSDSKWVALIGGEPMEQDWKELAMLIKLIRGSGKNIILFTSYGSPFTFEVDHYHIDIKVEKDGYYWVPPHLAHKVSFGIVAKEYNSFLLESKLVKVPFESPIYIKSHIPPLDRNYTETVQTWLKELGYYYTYINKKINV